MIRTDLACTDRSRSESSRVFEYLNVRAGHGFESRRIDLSGFIVGSIYLKMDDINSAHQVEGMKWVHDCPKETEKFILNSIEADGRWFTALNCRTGQIERNSLADYGIIPYKNDLWHNSHFVIPFVDEEEKII